eukprot:958359-Alexandrium_andersonii.AAC.1
MPCSWKRLTPLPFMILRGHRHDELNALGMPTNQALIPSICSLCRGSENVNKHALHQSHDEHHVLMPPTQHSGELMLAVIM